MCRYGTNTPIDAFRQIFNTYDGTNAADVLRQGAKDGLFHSPVPGATSFNAGSCSVEEVATVKDILTPASEKVIRAYLLDVVTDAQGAAYLKLRDVATQKVYTEPVEPGAFIVNCTSHLVNLRHDPVLSCNGRVLSPQQLCGFTGPSANYATHLFYLGKLEKLWPRIPRWSITRDHTKAGIELLMMVVIGNLLVTRDIPKGIREAYTPPGPSIPYHRLLFAAPRFVNDIPGFIKKLTALLTKRYTDEPDASGLTGGARGAGVVAGSALGVAEAAGRQASKL